MEGRQVDPLYVVIIVVVLMQLYDMIDGWDGGRAGAPEKNILLRRPFSAVLSKISGPLSKISVKAPFL